MKSKSHLVGLCNYMVRVHSNQHLFSVQLYLNISESLQFRQESL